MSNYTCCFIKLYIMPIEYFSVGSCLAPLSKDTMDKRDNFSLWSIMFSRSEAGMHERILLLVITFSMTDGGMMSTMLAAFFDIREMVAQGRVVRNQGSDRKWTKGFNSDGWINVGREG